MHGRCILRGASLGTLTSQMERDMARSYETALEGRRPLKGGGFGVWGRINTFKGDDSARIRKEAEDELFGWNQHALDSRGPFLNWQFRLREEVRRRAR